jgi:GLPGLI family protein
MVYGLMSWHKCKKDHGCRKTSLTLINIRERKLNLQHIPGEIILSKRMTMKCVRILIGLLILSPAVVAQMKQGRIVYEKKTQLQVQIQDPAFQNLIPKERKDRFELLFDNNKTLWRTADEGQDDEMNFDNGSGAQIRIVTPGSNDVLFSDLETSRKVEQREVMTKQFTIEDSIRRMNWKLGNETKEILGYKCKMATTTRTQKSTRVNMDNGQFKREEIQDTLHITAWFTDAIPLAAGPESYQGQLPGTILEIDVNNGRNKITAVEMSAKMDPKEIKEPKGKKISQEEFNREREKIIKQMNENGGGNFNIRTGG